MSSWLDAEVDEHTKLFDDVQEKSRSCGRYGKEYWQARRVFLMSYRFREERFGLKEKFKGEVKRVGRTMARVLEDTRREVGRRSVGIRVFRARAALASLLLKAVRCFVPGPGKRAIID